MIRASTVVGAGTWTDEPSDSVVLDFDDRHRRRTTMAGVRGLQFLLDLPEAVMLRGGDGVVLEDGRIVEVVAAPEDLLEVRGTDPRDLVRLAWHIGNRHLPAQIMPKAIRIRCDHVIEEMLRGLGARVVSVAAPFDPEGGAYASGREDRQHHAGHAGHRHDHGHQHVHHDPAHAHGAPKHDH